MAVLLPSFHSYVSSAACRWTNARFTRLGFLCLTAIILILLVLSLGHTESLSTVHRYIQPLRTWTGFASSGNATSEALWRSNDGVLNYPHSTPKFRDNLRNDTYYITSWAVAGFTNQFIVYINLLYLGFMSERVVIVPPFVPDNFWYNSPVPLPFGAIYNLTRLKDHLRHPILEWHDIKSGILEPQDSDNFTPAENTEQLGCWSTQFRTEDEVREPVHLTERVLGLDVSYTRVPEFTWTSPDKGRIFITFPSLSALVNPKRPYARPSSYPIMEAAGSGAKLSPDEQLTCFDFLYFVTSGVEEYEFMYDWAPVWTVIGTHLHFTDRLKEITTEYLVRLFNVVDGKVPPMMTVHIRRGDFSEFLCQGDEPPCIIPFKTYINEVTRIQGELRGRGIDASNVFISSDEKDPEWWADISRQGWKYFNHTEEGTVERFGDYYPLLIDKVALSMGAGFVGTERSTFSVFNQRRVEDWNNAITILAKYVP